MLKKIIAVLMILSMILPMLSIEVLASDTEMGNIGFESWNSTYSESCFRVNDVSGIGNYMVSEKLYGSEGVYFDEKRLGAACFDGTKISYIMGEKIDAMFHGTGDVFASVLTAGIITGRSLVSATEIAVKFTCDCIKATLENDPDRHYGVNFETEIPKLIKYLGIDYEG